eukprot:scaffold64568_cov30-Phaeocystis_antarctica.AAC.1
MALLTMALLTMALLTMALLTMALLTMALPTRCDAVDINLGCPQRSTCPSSAPAPSQGAPGGSGQLGTPRARPSHWVPRPPPRELERSTSKSTMLPPLTTQAAHRQARPLRRLLARGVRG